MTFQPFNRNFPEGLAAICNPILFDANLMDGIFESSECAAPADTIQQTVAEFLIFDAIAEALHDGELVPFQISRTESRCAIQQPRPRFGQPCPGITPNPG